MISSTCCPTCHANPDHQNSVEGRVSGRTVAMKTLFTFYACLVCTTLLVTVGWAATVVDVSYSHRMISTIGPPEPGFPEGAIIATFTADRPVEPAVPDTTLARINDRIFRYTFVWNETEVKIIDFIDGAGDTTHVEAWPEPVYPFDPAVHTVPVVHVRTDSTHLWDPATGIYVWGENENCLQHGSEWERPAFWDFYAGGDVPIISEPIGLRIHGGWSRNLDQKGLRFYFDGYGTGNEIDYDFFDSEPTSFRRLIIRTGRYPELAVNSIVAEGVFQDLGHLGSRFAFTVVYLNREYWGVYNLRERIDEEFIEHTHDLGGDGYILMKDGDSVHGDGSEFYDFLGFFGEPADYSSHAWFASVDNQVDLTTYSDWLIINIFGASADNGFDDNSVQLKVGSDKWQFLAWDEDDLFTPENVNSDHFRFYSAAGQAEWNQFLPPVAWFGVWTPEIQEWASMFNSLMHNSEFKALFADRVRELLGTELSVTALNDRIDAVVAVQEPEIGMHFDRWGGGSEASYASHINVTRAWIAQRHPIVLSQLEGFLDHFGVPVELSRFSATDVDDHVTVTWRTERETDNLGFVLYRSIGSPEAMVEIASYLSEPELVGQLNATTPTEYQFLDTGAVNNQVNYYELHHVNSNQEVTVHNWVESAWPLSWNGLVLNELMASNDTTTTDELGEFDDWFELYNGSGTTVYLDGLYVTDDPALPTKHRLTGGAAIPPGGHYRLWADNDLAQGDRHCAFKLSAGGEALALFAPDGLTIVDSVSFGQQLTDVTFQRYPDGEAPWTYGYSPTPETVNAAPELARLLVINEIAPQNETTIQDEAGDYDPWLEIHNPLPVDVAVGQLALTDEPSNPVKWLFPDALIGGQDFLIVWADAELAEGPLHTNFTLATGGGWLGLFEAGNQRLIHEANYPVLEPDITWAQIPDRSETWLATSVATPGTANIADNPPPHLFINEFLASNDNVNQDELGDFDDWVEIYNPGPDAVPLGGLFLTDDLTDPIKWVLPDVELAPGAFLLVWCDDEVIEGPLHAPFKLSASGEDIGLFDRLEQGNGLIDGYTFGPQTTDISGGRQTDGGLPWVFFTSPTPGAGNGVPAQVPGADPAKLVLWANYPNPFNPQTTIAFDLPDQAAVSLRVFDVSGRLVRVLLGGDIVAAGWREAVWNGRDDAGRQVASGTYFYRLEAGENAETRRMALIK